MRLLRLESRKLFARATFARRLSYYSHRMSSPELREAVVKRKTRDTGYAQIRRDNDTSMTRLIQETRRLAKTASPSV